MTNMRDLVHDVEDTSIKAMNTHDPQAEQHLYKLLGDASTNRTTMNDMAAVLQADSALRFADAGFPGITVVYSSPESDPDRHVVDIQFRQKTHSEMPLPELLPKLEWTEK